MAWIEKYKDRWFNSVNPEGLTAVVAPEISADPEWFAMNLEYGDVDGFRTAEAAMRFVDEHPDLFPPKQKDR